MHPSRGMISIKTHGIVDYVLGVILCLTPSIFGMTDFPSAQAVFLVLGIGLIVYSLCTNYDLSVFKWIPLGVHLGLDVLAGLVLMVAPWIFGYVGLLTGGQMAAHFVLGLCAVGLVAVTRIDPFERRGQTIEDEEGLKTNPEIDIKRAA